ncbi:MAG: AAA family ATPase [Propionibacteriaceae bacterium]|nr:AAA family ATPase [Propionibacteriaceae bacterium]
MVRHPNPFKPTAGANPPLLVGRGELIDLFADSLADGPGAPGRLTLYSGPRGVGKTVMLNAVGERAAEEFQWRVIHETATKGFLERIKSHAEQMLAEMKPRSRKLTGVSVPVLSVSLSDDPTSVELGLRQALTEVIESLEAHGTGLLLTIDEIQMADLEELKQFSATVQHLVREDREIAVVMAGLPTGINKLLDEKSGTTFLRRADRYSLVNVDLGEVSEALKETIEANGRLIGKAALQQAAAATGGYPFMMQLVGYHIWRKATSKRIDSAAVEAGVDAARTRLGALVHATALKDLSEVDRTFLLAMAQDSGPSQLSSIAERMEKSNSYLSVYRSRLLDAGMIRTTKYGSVDFALPFLREYLQTHGAHEEMASRL